MVSRVEPQQYVHGATSLLAIQIDAAINPGACGPLSVYSRCFIRICNAMVGVPHRPILPSLPTVRVRALWLSLGLGCGVWQYVHGATSLLAIQIDAAINPGPCQSRVEGVGCRFRVQAPRV